MPTTAELIETALEKMESAQTMWADRETASSVLRKMREVQDAVRAVVAQLEAHCGD